jgi:F0F1-type ATP synthase membrane subunit b/b'
MFSDPQFGVALAFALFVIAVFKPVRKILSTSLDSKIKEIKDSIDEAEDLKNETQITLSDIKKRQNEVELEIQEIHYNAKEKIKIIESEAKKKLDEQSNKREQLAKTKIEQMARDANLSIQNNISQTAIIAAIAVLEKKLNKEDKQNLINQSIKDFAIVQKN